MSTHVAVDLLYGVGGLYGNEQALNAVLDLFDREAGPSTAFRYEPTQTNQYQNLIVD